MNKEVVSRLKPFSGNSKRTPSLLPELCACEPEQALVRLEASRSGLTEEQVEARLDQYGPNEVTHEKPPTWYQQLFHAFLTPFNGVLFAVSVVSLFSDVIFTPPEDRSFRTIIVLITMILLSTLLRFWQEFRSNKAAEELKAMVTSTAAVLRAGMDRPQELPIAALVPGDIVGSMCGAPEATSSFAFGEPPIQLGRNML
jgi:Mg2+-importing ATPase